MQAKNKRHSRYQLILFQSINRDENKYQPSSIVKRLGQNDLWLIDCLELVIMPSRFARILILRLAIIRAGFHLRISKHEWGHTALEEVKNAGRFHLTRINVFRPYCARGILKKRNILPVNLDLDLRNSRSEKLHDYGKSAIVYETELGF